MPKGILTDTQVLAFVKVALHFVQKKEGYNEAKVACKMLYIHMAEKQVENKHKELIIRAAQFTKGN